MAWRENVTFGSLKVERNFTIGDTQQTATTAEVNAVADVSAQAAVMVKGSGVSSAYLVTNTVARVGDLITVTMLLDISLLKSGGTANDIIGNDAAANCHFGQLPASIDSIYGGRMTCLVAPTIGDTDIDLYSAGDATGVQDEPITGLVGDQKLTNHGVWSVGDVSILDQGLLPAGTEYIYLAGGAGTSGVYTNGVFMIELWGIPA
jgi:hypothetical protein